MILALSILLCLESIPEGSFLYPGSKPREVISVDPARSPYLSRAYEKFEITEDLSEEQILNCLLHYVREELFDLNLCNKWDLINLIHTLYPDETEPEIPLDEFLKHKTGLCRHLALTTTYLIDRLIKDGWLQGNAYLIRENCPTGRHAWTLYLSEEGAWHLDSLWGVLENGKTSAGFSNLCDNYGKRNMYEQKKRWEIAP